MTQVLRGNIIQAPRLGELDIREHGYLVLEDGVVQGIYEALPQALASAPITDYGDRLIMQSFVDMHLHAPQYPMLGMGMDLPLLDWLNTYTFRTEARFADPDFARRTYRRLASDLITNGTTRVCMFSSLHTEATWILMEELERAGVTGYVGKGFVRFRFHTGALVDGYHRRRRSGSGAPARLLLRSFDAVGCIPGRFCRRCVRLTFLSSWFSGSAGRRALFRLFLIQVGIGLGRRSFRRS